MASGSCWTAAWTTWKRSESDGEETVSVEVTHFSDLIATINDTEASEKSKGYITKLIRHKLLRLVRPIENDRAKLRYRFSCTW